MARRDYFLLQQVSTAFALPVHAMYVQLEALFCKEASSIDGYRAFALTIQRSRDAAFYLTYHYTSSIVPEPL